MAQMVVADGAKGERAPVSLWRNLLAAPVIYSVLAPLLLLDLAASLYQAVCFRLWQIPRARRHDYVRIDRHKLAYLNPLQKLNCVYCSYANGVLAYVAEIGSRTEQFWCPIKHPEPPLAPHRRYEAFLPYGDSRDLAARWEDLRAKVQAPPKD